MRIPSFPILVFLAMLVGCQSGPRPAPGLSGVNVKVIAQPKTGATPIHTSDYDYSSNLGSGDFERVDYSDLHDIVIWLEPADAKQMTASAAPTTIELNARGLSGGVSGVVSVGQRVTFRNAGAAPLSAYCVSDGNEFNLGTLAPGGQAEVIVRSEGLIEILADSIRDPVARIYAAPAPWVSLTHSGATVNFNNLPPGNYRIVSWHPRLPGSTTEVTLAPDQVAAVSVTVGVNQLPKISAK